MSGFALGDGKDYEIIDCATSEANGVSPEVCYELHRVEDGARTHLATFEQLPGGGLHVSFRAQGISPQILEEAMERVAGHVASFNRRR